MLASREKSGVPGLLAVFVAEEYCLYNRRSSQLRVFMSSTLYEVVMLTNGDVVLKRADETEEPLIRISFSDEARFFLNDLQLDVARAMIDAGIEAVEQIDILGDETQAPPRLLH